MSKSEDLPFKKINPELRKYGPCLRGRVLILEGLISAGKSTAGIETAKYVESLGIPCKFFPEPLIDSLLQLFLSDQKKYAFSFQLAMLIKRQAIYREAWEYANKGYFCIIDRSLYGDYCFALMHKNKGNICDEPACLDKTSLSEWKTYVSTLHSEQFEHPDYVLYLEVTPETAIKRCKQRARDGEGAYTPQYFQELCDVYASVIPSSPAKGMDVVDWNSDRTIAEIPRAILDRVKKLYDKGIVN